MLYFQDKRLGLPRRSTEKFSISLLAAVHFTLPPSDSPSHYTLLLHEAQAIDPSDNPVFHIGRLILTQSLGADARSILQVLEHAEYERRSLIYIPPEPLGQEELHEKHCYEWGSDWFASFSATLYAWSHIRLKIRHTPWHTWLLICMHTAEHS